jgi:hypothetical protein
MDALPTTPLSASPGQSLPSWANLKAIADAQRLAIFALLAGILAIPAAAAVAIPYGVTSPGFTELLPFLVLVVVVGVRLWMAIAVFRLARALGSGIGGGLLWAVGTFIPNIIGVIVLVVVSARATSRLKRAGLKVGLLGAKLAANPPPGFLCQEVAGTFS